MRIFPVIGVGQLRLVAADTVLAGHLSVRAGTVLWMPHHAMHNSTLNWDEPHVFRPGEHEHGMWKEPNGLLSCIVLLQCWVHNEACPADHSHACHCSARSSCSECILLTSSLLCRALGDARCRAG